MADEETVEAESQPSMEETIAAEIDSAAVDIPPPPAPEPELEPLTPPHSWGQDVKDLFPNWPREAQEQLLRRQLDMEGDYTRTKQDLATQRRDLENRYGGLEQAIEPFRETLTRRGLTPAQVVSQALSIEKMLSDNPQQGLQWLAQRYGIQLPQQGQVDQPTQPGVQPQPQVQQQLPPNPQLTQMQQQLQRMQQAQQQRELELQRQQEASLAAEVERFKAEKDEQGSLLRPYLAEVEGAMVPFVSALRQSNPTATNAEILDQAYQIAVQRNPDVSTRMEQEAQLRRREELARKAKEAEEAASSLDVPTNGVTKSRKSKNTAEDDVKLAMKEHGF